MVRRLRPVALIAAVAAICALPAASAAASTVTFGDATGDMSQFAVDLGATTVAVSDDAVSVETAIVPRPPAGWGGCAYLIGEACIPAEMNVSWYLDFAPAAGSVADEGADARIVVVPEPGRSLWESELWSSAGGRFLPGPRPLGSQEPDSVRWSLRLSDLGIARPATVRIWAVSFFGAQPGLGAPIDYEDRAGPATILLDEGAAGTGREAGSTARCKRKAAASARRRRMRLLSDVAVAPGRALGATKRRCAQSSA